MFSGGGARERSPKFVVVDARDFGERSRALVLLKTIFIRHQLKEANSRSIDHALSLPRNDKIIWGVLNVIYP